jgi:hypothetical protein
MEHALRSSIASFLCERYAAFPDEFRGPVPADFRGRLSLPDQCPEWSEGEAIFLYPIKYSLSEKYPLIQIYL